MSPEERPVHFLRDHLGDQVRPWVGRQSGAEALPDQHDERECQDGWLVSTGKQQGQQREAEEGQPLVDGHRQGQRSVALHAGDPAAR